MGKTSAERVNGTEPVDTLHVMAEPIPGRPLSDVSPDIRPGQPCPVPRTTGMIAGSCKQNVAAVESFGNVVHDGYRRGSGRVWDDEGGSGADAIGLVAENR